jgi:transporter family protein
MIPDWYVYALLGAIAAALASILAKMGLQNVDSITATALRSIVMTIMVFGILYFTRGFSGLAKLTQREYIYILLSGLAGGASWILYFIALQRGEASKVAIVDRSSIVFVIILAALILGEELTLRKIIAAILVFTALALLAI